jgi:crotonobetainyl-CoA:carnitine CoA-transferase CaiB-like acyl-CoA transferase
VDGVRPSATPWAPTAGQHTDEILLGAGCTDDEVARLRADGVIA